MGRKKSDQVQDVIKRITKKLSAWYSFFDEAERNIVDDVMEEEGFKFVMKKEDWERIPSDLRKRIMEDWDAWNFDELYDKTTLWDTFTDGSFGCEGIYHRATSDYDIVVIPCMIYYKMNRKFTLDKLHVYLRKRGV